MAKLMDRMMGRPATGSNALGDWWTGTEYASTVAKIAELRAQLPALIEAHGHSNRGEPAAVATLRTTRGKHLIGEKSADDLRLAERELKAVQDRALAAEASIAANQSATAELEARLPDLEYQARAAHVETVIRPWYEAKLATLETQLAAVVATNDEMLSGFAAIEEHFSNAWEAPTIYRPVNNYITSLPIWNMGWRELTTRAGSVYDQWRQRLATRTTRAA